MKKILLAGAAVGMLALAAPAQAHPTHHYVGQCRISSVSDGGDDDQTTWTGQASIAVVATDASGVVPAPTAPISGQCDVYRNGVFFQTAVTASGTGAASNAVPWTYQSDPDDVMTVCTVVEVNGEPHSDCRDLTTTPIVPEPVQQVITFIIDTLNNEVFSKIDPTICPFLATGAPGIPGVIDINEEGDVSIAGDLFWDCPPYETP